VGVARCLISWRADLRGVRAGAADQKWALVAESPSRQSPILRKFRTQFIEKKSKGQGKFSVTKNIQHER